MLGAVKSAGGGSSVPRPKKQLEEEEEEEEEEEVSDDDDGDGDDAASSGDSDDEVASAVRSAPVSPWPEDVAARQRGPRARRLSEPRVFAASEVGAKIDAATLRAVRYMLQPPKQAAVQAGYSEADADTAAVLAASLRARTASHAPATRPSVIFAPEREAHGHAHRVGRAPAGRSAPAGLSDVGVLGWWRQGRRTYRQWLREHPHVDSAQLVTLGVFVALLFLMLWELFNTYRYLMRPLLIKHGYLHPHEDL